MILNVYTPKPGSSAAGLVLAGSAIVGAGEQDGRILCYYEGNAIGSKGLESFYERVRRAASRLVTKYPTTAMAAFPVEELECVATFDAEREYLPSITDFRTLERWAQEPGLIIQGPDLPEGAHLTSTIGTRFEKAFPRLLKREGPVHTYTLRCGQIVVINIASGMSEVIHPTDRLADSIRQEVRSGP
ncbi:MULTISPECIES: hypothetical protein [Microvirga]|uniref:hypothetical protein n=1 Tax=Microvirga TaxID=186650 RepID=UPI0021C6B32D|nr:MULTISPECIES: hypothetical protein [unclassified Microvirga]